MLRLLLIAAAFIVYGSLYPFEFDFGRTGASPLTVLLHSWPARIDRFAWRDACVNVLLYFPLGLTAVLAFPRRWLTSPLAPSARYFLSSRLTCRTVIPNIAAASFCFRRFCPKRCITSNRLNSFALIVSVFSTFLSSREGDILT